MKQELRRQRHRKIRMRITGTAERPRLAVFRSNRYLSAQLIDDTTGKTLLAVTDAKGIKKGAKAPKATVTRTVSAQNAGKELAKAALAKKISTVVFDRGGFLYAGRIKAFADSAREGGLQF